MIRAIKYQTILLIFFCLLCGIVSAHSSVAREGLGFELDSVKSKRPLFASDSITSNKKSRESKKISDSKANSYRANPLVWHTNLRKDVSEAARREQGNSVSTNSHAINDRLNPSSIGNMVSFNIYDKALNVHSFSGTQSLMFGLNFTSENNVNTKRELFGFEYRFKKVDTTNFGYSARARLERDDANQTYYQLGLGASLRGEKSMNLLALEHFPVRSGPGHILEIYRTQLTNYNEIQFSNELKQIVSFEGSYYSDQQADFVVLSRTEYLLFESEVFKLSPLVEAAYGLGSIDRRDSYPYWLAEKRTYGGGGFALGIGSDKSAFQVIADASIFAELGQANFERYTGNLSYQIEGFTRVNAGFEVYTIENFYSNVFQLGMVYNFK